MKSVDVGGEEPSKAELVRMVSQFLLQNGMPVTAAALQKECEKLLLAKSSGASSNGGNKAARGRQQQRQESERCLADRLLDGKRAAQQQNMPPSPPSTTTIPMEPTAIKSPRHSPAISADRQSPRRKGASSQPAGQRKARSGPAARHPPVSGRQIQPAPHSSTHGGRSQRSTSQKPSANGGGITDMEPESCWPDEQRSAKLGRKADSTGNIAAPPTQTPPPADPVQARPSATVKPNTWTEELPLVAEQEQQEVNEQSRWLCTHLDFASIAQTLTKAGPGREAALLVQAIRQQLTKAGSLADGEANLRAFVAKDVLQLHNRKQPLTSLLLTDASTLPELKEQLARLLNAMASFRRGRDYLLSVGHGRQLFYEACTALKSRRLVGHAVDQLLATLQKLSIRPAAQKELLLNGLLEWLALALPQPRLGPAALEFGAALLHNLTLNPLAQSSVLRHKDSLLAGLHWLIGQTRNGQVLHYACATLFTLLGQVRVRQSARERGDLERVVNERLQRADQQQQQPQQQQRAGDEQRQQLMALNLILRGELEPERRKPTDGREDNEDLFPDYLEAEIDSTDPLVPAFSELFGHTLLAQKFLLPDAPVPPPKRVQLVQFAIEWEQESSVPGVVPRRLRQSNSRPPKANETSSPQRKQKQPGKTNLSGANGHHPPLIANGSQSAPPKDGSPAVLAICRQVHFERTNSMSSLATFVVENNNRRPLLAFNGFANVLTSLKSGPSQAKGEKALTLAQPRKRAGGDAENSSSSETLVLEEAPSRQQKMPTNRQTPATTAKQNQQQRHPNRVPEAQAQEASTRRTAAEVAKLFSSKLRTQQRGKWPRREKIQQQQQHQQMGKQQKNGETSASATMLDGEELIRSATFGGREMSEGIEERQPSFDDEYLAAFAARPKVIRTPPAEE